MKKALMFSAMALVAASAFAKSDALSLVPADAVTVGVVRLSDMRSSPLSGALFAQTDKIATDGDAANFLREAGLQPSKDVDLLVVATSPKSGNLSKDADILVAAEGRFNVDRLTAALVTRGAKKMANYIQLPHGDNDERSAALAFPNAGLAVMGTENAVTEALAAYAKGGAGFASASALGREMSRIDPHATAWALVDVARASRLAGGPHITSKEHSAQALSSALKNVSTVAMWAVDTGDQIKLSAIGLSSDAETLGLLEDTLRGALSAMRLAVQEKQPDLVAVLRRFTVSRSNDSISISGSVSAETFKEFAAKKTK
jgi:hypothetical protein